MSIVREGAARAVAGLLMVGASTIATAVHSKTDEARAHIDAVLVCERFEEGMAGILEAAGDLDWRLLTNADYAEWGHLIQEIIWTRLVSHDPMARRDANIEAMVNMKRAISSEHEAAKSYIANADPSELFGDPTRRLLVNPAAPDAVLVLMSPGAYGAGADCVVVSTDVPPKSFLSLFSDLREFPAANAMMTAAQFSARVVQPTETEAGTFTIVREIDPERLAAFTDYKMHLRHSFEVKMYEKRPAE
ncbi:hypothetical protein [Marivita hallyeonensis]|uniref:Uncharacterized protein n=1 Tax=Marivita hallyeonensis TaxID=996342 RepID=A0A1M5WWA0_9RHOB|nr:hypothetical protein [Marivita hallyeonensis]SHH91414.1 hypothetical protein SAMN05443551_3540 [Marivita hallyeonensis]